MSKYRTTYNVVTIAGAHLKSQNTLERLKQDDPCWHSKDVWITYEPAIEPREKDQLNIEFIDDKAHNPTIKPHWSTK
jgi:hypothetical protein